jgi:adenine-specific DNA methylase
LSAFAASCASVREAAELAGSDSSFWVHLSKSGPPKDAVELRSGLLRFIAVLSRPEAAENRWVLEPARALTEAAAVSLRASGDSPSERFVVADPFSGGGAIPLEAARLGTTAIASDLNPVALVICKTQLEAVPRWGEKITDHLNSWLSYASARATEDLAPFYPRHSDGAQPIAYLWARTVLSEAPDGGDAPVEVPLLRSMWLARKARRQVALRWQRDSAGAVKTVKVTRTYADGSTRQVRQPLLEIFSPGSKADVASGTAKRNAAVCPVSGYTTPARRVEAQLKARKGGALDARLYCVVVDTVDGDRQFRLPTSDDLNAAEAARGELASRSRAHSDPLSLVPDEPLPVMSGVFNAPIYGHSNWGLLFTPRQALALTCYSRYARNYIDGIADASEREATALALGLIVDRLADLNASLCVWQLNTANTAHVFGRWALPMVVDFGEVNPLAAAGGSPESAIRRARLCIERLVAANYSAGSVVSASATEFPLPDDSVDVVFTDPPYYNAVPYADLMDFFYVWLRRTIGGQFPSLFASALTPKDPELCEMAGWDPVRYPHKDKAFFERGMTSALIRARQVVKPDGLCVIVFAHKSTSGWEALLQAVISAGWVVTASWPIDTEMASRLRAKNSAALASSVHLVCRPKEDADGHLRVTEVGDWRSVLSELPRRIHEWLPRLAAEGIVGADAIFACLGPALEVFSKHGRVEKVSGEVVGLAEYLEHVWAVVSREALSMIFSGAETEGLEPDGRLTAIWLWTLATPGAESDGDVEADVSSDDEEGDLPSTLGGLVLEFDAARKIAQGLGAHLEELTHVVQVKGERAVLLSVGERANYLFGKDESSQPSKRAVKKKQMTLFGEIEAAAEKHGWADGGAPKAGLTTLDRIHQAMLLFGAGRGEALKRFLVDEGAGREARFWRFAQALSALYPVGSDEKRWVDGVLARQKGLGF